MIKEFAQLNFLSFLRSKVNAYSIIGSIIYGLLLALFPTPEIVAVIGHVAYFLIAALFYFLMYVVYSTHKVQLRRNLAKKIMWGILGFCSLVIIMSVVYMFVFHLPFQEAGDKFAVHMGTFFYYLPFLP